MKPFVICHMMSSIDGRILVDRWSKVPGVSRQEQSALYAEIHEALAGDAWLVGRATMAEMTDAGPHASAAAGGAERPYHLAGVKGASYAIALDPSGKLHWDRADIDGDHIVVLLGHDVPDSHLNELAGDGISYIVAPGPDLDLAATLDVLGRELGIRRLLLEGGGAINGSFLAAGLVDEISLLVFPAIDGRPSSRAVFEAGDDGFAGRVELTLTSCETLAAGAVHLRYAVRLAPMAAA